MLSIQFVQSLFNDVGLRLISTTCDENSVHLVLVFLLFLFLAATSLTLRSALGAAESDTTVLADGVRHSLTSLFETVPVEIFSARTSGYVADTSVAVEFPTDTTEES